MFTYLIKFLRSDACLFERKIDFLPVEAESRENAIQIFNKFLGIPYNYLVLDISLYEY